MSRPIPSHLRRVAIAAASATALVAGGLGAASLSPAAADSSPTLAAHYALDEGSGTTAADSSGNGANGTLSSGASWTAGQVGTHAAAFNGSSGNVDIPKPVVDTSQSFTVSAWVKLNSTSGYQTAVSIDGSNISGFFLQLSGSTGAFAFTRRTADDAGATEVRADSSVVPTAGTWYHIVGVDDVAAGKLKIYVDGQEGSDAAFTGGWKAAGHTEIGRGFYNGGATDWVNGAVDDVRFYQGALTTAQAESVNQDAHWTYDEGSGTSAADSSGNGHTATLGSGAGWTTAARIGTHALTLDGSANATATATGPAADTSQGFSVAAWVKLNKTTGDQTIVTGKGANAAGYALQFRSSTGKFAFGRAASDSASAAVTYADAASAPNTGTWYHLIGVDDVNAGKLELYVNGALAGSASYSGGWKASGDTVVGGGLSGVVDDVQVYDHPLTTDEVEQLVGNAGGGLTVDAAAKHTLPSTFFGLMTEDINHSMTGGLYPELINNRSMMADPANPVDWNTVGDATEALDSGTPLNSALTRSLKVTLGSTVGHGARAGVSNSGYWGIPVTPSQHYTASFFAKASAGLHGPLTVDVESADGTTVYASAKVNGVGTSWKQYTVTLSTPSDAPVTAAARFVVSAESGAGRTLWLDNVSLFPPTYQNVKNGLRVDLMQKFAAMKPAFIREPGGNFLEGNTLSTYFNWKNTIGPVWTRPGHQDDAWGYWSTDGMGLLEYLEWCEQLGAKPLLAVFAGYTLNHTVVPQNQLQPYVQDALDEIQYATGSTSTPWGKKRAQDGHPAPFKIDYVEIGNEDMFDSTGSYNSYRFPMFYDAIKKAYPKMKLVATTTTVTSRTPDVVDDHFYQSPAWFNSHANYYDSASRSGPKVMVGEWASQEGAPTPDLNAALGDASWLTGLMRNSDLVTQEAYAPMLVNVNDDRWATNLIGFDALTSYGSPSYYVQQMLANAHGDQVIGDSYSGVGGINTVATRDSRTGKIYLVVVNPGSKAQPVAVDLNGVGKVASTGTATVITSAHPSDTNTISNPANVVPTTSTVTGLGASFTHTFPAYSVTVLTIG
jgi:alpha-L-arabinofuranosidase